MLRSPLLVALGCAMLLPALPLRADPSTGAAQPDRTTDASGPATPAGADARDPRAGDTAAGDMRRGSRSGDQQAFLDARLAAVHAGLELSPDQEKLWPPVDAALRDIVHARRALRHTRHVADGSARLKARGVEMIALGTALQKLADAGTPLAATMTPDQKRRLPRLARHLPRRALQLALGIDGDRDGHDGGMDGGIDYDRPHQWRHGWNGNGWGGDGWRRGEGWQDGGGDPMHSGGMGRDRNRGPDLGNQDEAPGSRRFRDGADERG